MSSSRWAEREFAAEVVYEFFIFLHVRPFFMILVHHRNSVKRRIQTELQTSRRHCSNFNRVSYTKRFRETLRPLSVFSNLTWRSGFYRIHVLAATPGIKPVVKSSLSRNLEAPRSR